MSARGHANHDDRDERRPARKPFRAVDVLSGGIDRGDKTGRNGTDAPARTRKQISAQLEPPQIRLLGELHARLNAEAQSRIEKSDLVGLGIELLAAVLDGTGREPAPEPDGASRRTDDGGRHEVDELDGFRNADELRAYVRTWIRRYGS